MAKDDMNTTIQQIANGTANSQNRPCVCRQLFRNAAAGVAPSKTRRGIANSQRAYSQAAKKRYAADIAPAMITAIHQLKGCTLM